MKRFRPSTVSLCIFCLSLLIRILYNVTVAHAYTPLHDSLQYQNLGFDLIYHHIFGLDSIHASYIPTVNRAPLWPILIGLLSLVFGRSDFFVRLFLCFLDAGSCVLVSLFARNLFGKRAALVAGIIAALYPGLYIYTGWLYAETLYTFLLLAFCYTISGFYDGTQKGQAWKLIISGLLLGLLSLTRPNGLEVLVLFCCWLVLLGWQKMFPWRFVVRAGLLVTLITCVVIAPWTIRNAFVSHDFVPIATGDGTVLLGAYNDAILTKPVDQATWINPLQSSPRLAQSFHPAHCAAACEVEREAAFKDAAVQWIGAHLADMPYVLAAHLVNLWLPVVHEADLPTDRFPDQVATQVVLGMMPLCSLPLFLLAALGLWLTRQRWRELLFFYLLLLLTIGQCLAFYGSPRFRAPIEPMLVILAVGALWHLRWMRHLLRHSPCGKIETIR